MDERPVLHADLPQARKFDSLAREWRITNTFIGREGNTVQTTARNWGGQHLDGRVVVDFFEGTYYDGSLLKGMTIRAYDPEQELWLLQWLDNQQPPNLTPLVGKFEGDEGLFYRQVEHEGQPLQVRFRWSHITEDSARWENGYSMDGGKTWRTSWVMEFSLPSQSDPD